MIKYTELNHCETSLQSHTHYSSASCRIITAQWSTRLQINLSQMKVRCPERDCVLLTGNCKLQIGSSIKLAQCRCFRSSQKMYTTSICAISMREYACVRVFCLHMCVSVSVCTCRKSISVYLYINMYVRVYVFVCVCVAFIFIFIIWRSKILYCSYWTDLVCPTANLPLEISAIRIGCSLLRRIVSLATIWKVKGERWQRRKIKSVISEVLCLSERLLNI